MTSKRSYLSVTSLIDFPASTVIFREGESCGRIYIVVEGAVALELKVAQEGRKRLHTVGEGELLGWSPLLDNELMTMTAYTLSPTRVLALEALQVLALCQHDTALGFLLMRKTAQALAQRLSAARLHLLDVYRNEMSVLPGNT